MSKKDFAFIVHSRDRSDLPRKFPILKFLPIFLFDFLSRNLPPIVVSKITGLINIHGKESTGLVIGIPMTAHQLLENRDLALKRILQAVHIAKSNGAKYIGLGAMTASLTRGGRDVIEHIPDIFITTGRTYTIKNITDYIFLCMKIFNLQKSKIKIGIVGAAGGIGSGVAIMLARNGFKNFLLIDLERKLEHVRNKIILIEDDAKDLIIEISQRVSSTSSCDIIIAATSAPEVVIKSLDISPGTIIINDAQPSDVSPEIVMNRADVLVIEGGVLSTKNINCHFNMGLYDKHDIFSCLAETLILSYRDSGTHYSIDENNLNGDFLNKLTEDGQNLNFFIKEPQNSLGYISKDYLNNFSFFMKDRHQEK